MGTRPQQENWDKHTFQFGPGSIAFNLPAQKYMKKKAFFNIKNYLKLLRIGLAVCYCVFEKAINLRVGNETIMIQLFWRHTTMKGPVLDQGKKIGTVSKNQSQEARQDREGPVPSNLFSETRLSCCQPKDCANCKGRNKKTYGTITLAL